MVMTGRWCKWHCFTNIKYYGVPWFSYSNWWFFTAIFSNNQGVNDHLMSNGGRLWPTNPRLTNWMALGFPYHIPIFSSWYYIYIYLIYIYIYPHWLMCTSQDFCCWTSQVLQMSPSFLIFLAYLHCSPNEQCSKSCVTLVGWGQDSVHGLWYSSI